MGVGGGGVDQLNSLEALLESPGSCISGSTKLGHLVFLLLEPLIAHCDVIPPCMLEGQHMVPIAG